MTLTERFARWISPSLAERADYAMECLDLAHQWKGHWEQACVHNRQMLHELDAVSTAIGSGAPQVFITHHVDQATMLLREMGEAADVPARFRHRCAEHAAALTTTA